MNKKIKKYIKEIIIFFFALFILSNVLSYYKSLTLNKNNLDIESFILLDNSKYIVKNDKPIIIHFWASWCPTCKFEAANIEKISKDYEVITIAVQSGNKQNIQKYLDEHNLSFNVVNDEYSQYFKKFKIKAFPTTLIFNKNKELKFTDVGYMTSAGLYSRMFLLK